MTSSLNESIYCCAMKAINGRVWIFILGYSPLVENKLIHGHVHISYQDTF